MPTWLGSFFAFDERTVARTAPQSAGIYVLWRRGQWVYVGATMNLRERLTAIVKGDNECIARELPTEFGFEIIRAVEQREARRTDLVRYLEPICP